MAVMVALQNVCEFCKFDLSESLVIVTSDHDSAIFYSGFATPNDQSILGMDSLYFKF